jgi:hypothetical protein
MEQVKEHTRKIESEVRAFDDGVSETLFSSNNLYPPAEDKVLEVKRLKALDCKIQSLLNEVTTGEGAQILKQILKTDPIIKEEVKGLQNHREHLSRKIQLFYPETLEEFRQAIWWFLADPKNSEKLSLIREVKANPLYDENEEIQNLFRKAEAMLTKISNGSESSEQSPETMIAIAEIKDYSPDQPLQMGQSYYLKTGIKNDGLDENDPDSIQLDAVVWAEGMEISPKWIQPYILDKNQKLSLIQFQLKPTSLGSKRIRVEFYYERHWLGEVKLEAKVIEAKQPAPM